MSVRLIFLEAVSVVCGAVIGALAFIAVAWLFTDGMGEAMGFSGAMVALVTAVIFAVYYRYMAQTPAALAAFFTGVALPALAAGILIGGQATTLGAFVAYVVFSLVALLVYRLAFATLAGGNPFAPAPPGQEFGRDSRTPNP